MSPTLFPDFISFLKCACRHFTWLIFTVESNKLYLLHWLVGNPLAGCALHVLANYKNSGFLSLSFPLFLAASVLLTLHMCFVAFLI